MPKRHRYATREEVAELLVPFINAVDERFPDGEAKSIDYARQVLDALGEMGAPVDFLFKITVDEPLT